LFIDDPNNGQYLPYHPGIFSTSHGYRAELEGDHNPNFIETSQGYRAELDNNQNIPCLQRNITSNNDVNSLQGEKGTVLT
jgi:hypothetical protein